MIQTIIFFIERSFDTRDIKRFGIETLQQSGFKVEIWDFSAIFTPDMHPPGLPEELESLVRRHRSRDEATVAVKNLDQTSFVALYLTYQLRSLWLFRALSRSPAHYSVDTANAIPPIPRASRNLLRKLLSVKAEHLLNSLFCRLPVAQLGVKPPAFRIAGGKQSVPSGCREPVLWLHTMDYDLYLDNLDKPAVVQPKTGVFLDEYRPYHSDYAHQSITPPTTPEAYYPLLNRFFENLEHKYGVQIVIAAHPRSEYEKHPGIFGTRQVIKGKTAELVRTAGFVLMHCSTSINFLVMYRKPALFITTDSLSSHFEGPYIDIMAGLLGKQPINISREPDCDLNQELTVDEAAYDAYMEQYIKTSGTPDRHYWQQFADHIKSWQHQG